MFKYLSDKDKKKYKIILLILSILLILALVAIAALAWFSVDNNSNKTLNLKLGKVDYTIDSSDKLFYSALEFYDEAYEDDFDDSDGYVAATKITTVRAGVDDIVYNGGYSYDIMQSSRIRLQPIFDPANATDKVTYSSSNTSAVTVSTYGTISAIGDIGQSSVITITCTDRTPGEEKRDNNLTVKVLVTIIENTNEDANKYGYLPGNVNILRNGLSVTNKSSVASKVRIKISWEYKNFDDSGDENEGSNEYLVSDIYKEVGTTTGEIKVANAVLAPLILNINTDWSQVPFDSDAILLSDINGLNWNVERLYLTDSDYTNLINSLKGNTNFNITEKMIDSASMYVCYSGGTAITSSSGDYGALVDKAADVDVGVAYKALDKMVTSEMYAGFSNKKVFSVSINVQARQAKFYDENNWYDVYCAKEDFGGTNHQVVTTD